MQQRKFTNNHKHFAGALIDLHLSKCSSNALAMPWLCLNCPWSCLFKSHPAFLCFSFCWLLVKVGSTAGPATNYQPYQHQTRRNRSSLETKSTEQLQHLTISITRIIKISNHNRIKLNQWGQDYCIHSSKEQTWIRANPGNSIWCQGNK